MADPTPEKFYEDWPCLFEVVPFMLQTLAFWSTTPAQYCPIEFITGTYMMFYGDQWEVRWDYDRAAFGLKVESIEIDGVTITAVDCRGAPATVVQEMLDTLGFPSSNPCDCRWQWWRYKADNPCG